MLSHISNEQTVDQWKLGRLLLDRWRRDLTDIDIELKRPKVVDLLPDSASGEPINGDGATQQLSGQIIYFTDEAITVRRACGAIVVLENHEIRELSDGQDHIKF